MNDSLIVEITDSIKQLPHDDWARISRSAGPYLAQAYLEVLEPSSRFAPRYILVRDRVRTLVAALPTYLCTEPQQSSFLYDPFEQFVREASTDEVASEWFPVLIVGGRSGMFNAPLIDQSLPADTRRQTVVRLREEIARLADSESAKSVAAMYFTSGGLAEMDGDIIPGGELLFSGYELSVSIEWQSFDQYFQSVPHRRRRQIRRERKRFQESGIDVSEMRLSDASGLVAPLIVELENSYGQTTCEAEWRDRLKELGRRYGDSAIAFVGIAGDVAVCANVVFSSGGELFSWVWGRKEEVARRDAAYFELCFHTPISYAIRTGLRRVHFGTIPYEPKLSRGATPAPLWTQLLRLGDMHPSLRASLRDHDRRRQATHSFGGGHRTELNEPKDHDD